VLGITALVSSISVDRSFYRLNWPAMMLFSLGLFYFLVNDGKLTPIEGLTLVIVLVIFLIILLKISKKNTNTDAIDESLASVTYFKIVIWLLIGALALYFGSDWLVNGAKSLAKSLGVSDAVIAATVIAIGTSVPELAASVIAAAKQEKALSLGNLIGSNIFNIGSVLGLTSIIKTLTVNETSILNNDIYWMLGFSTVLIPLILLPKAMQISRFKGFTLVIAYGIFVFLAFK
jgi:cation:H+ antiporter